VKSLGGPVRAGNIPNSIAVTGGQFTEKEMARAAREYLALGEPVEGNGG
jgi:hypothetical protein